MLGLFFDTISDCSCGGNGLSLRQTLLWLTAVFSIVDHVFIFPSKCNYYELEIRGIFYYFSGK